MNPMTPISLCNWQAQGQINLFLRYGLVLIATFFALFIPELAFADIPSCDGAGCFAGTEDVIKNTSSSFSYYWSLVRTWAIWGGLAWLLVSALFLKGQGWWVSLLIWSIAVFGEKVARYFASLGGITL